MNAALTQLQNKIADRMATIPDLNLVAFGYVPSGGMGYPYAFTELVNSEDIGQHHAFTESTINVYVLYGPGSGGRNVQELRDSSFTGASSVARALRTDQTFGGKCHSSTVTGPNRAVFRESGGYESFGVAWELKVLTDSGEYDPTLFFEDFTATTSGNLSDTGWLVAASEFEYESDGSGVQHKEAANNRAALRQIANADDVRVTASILLNKDPDAANTWQGIILRGRSAESGDGIYLRPHSEGETIRIGDGQPSSAAIADFDVTGLGIVSGALVELVVTFIGDTITLETVKIGTGTAQAVGLSHTLTGASKTDHGADSGARWYGIFSHERDTDSPERFKHFRVENLA